MKAERAANVAIDVISQTPIVSFDYKRDVYGFAIRPQHLQRYKEYASIYKEEEEERSDRWKAFLDGQSCCAQLPEDGIHGEKPQDKSLSKDDDSLPSLVDERNRMRIWTEIRPALHAIEEMMSLNVRRRGLEKIKPNASPRKELPTLQEPKHGKGVSGDDSEEEFYDLERSESDVQDMSPGDNIPAPVESASSHSTKLNTQLPRMEELECLVQGGVPMALRGEIWQVFVGVRAHRVEKYYQTLLPDRNVENKDTGVNDMNSTPENKVDGAHEKWRLQIEKDLPRTFPGHPALDENGRDALRRLLTAYARHNPSVGYCQAMNFFAGLLLLLMPEENAFWTLLCILDDYFDGYFSEEMIEFQVDQLVLEDLVRERFPKLVNHLDYLGVQVAWVTGPWFLTIFMNMLPWESVLRVWDVLLFEGNRVMLFRTALALMELYGPALVTTKDAGDAVTLLQSLAGSTFDSSLLVLTACMGYPNVHEKRLDELRDKRRPTVMAALEERSKGLASKLYCFKQRLGFMVVSNDKEDTKHTEANVPCLVDSVNDGDAYMSLNGNTEVEPAKDLENQVSWLKSELCILMEEKRSSELRAEELETALMEMVKQDNRRQLSARVEQLEREISELQQALVDKHEQENAMLQILMRVEQEQKVTEDARLYAEQDATAQRYAAQVLQEKYEEAMAALAEMENRAVMAESMLEATLNYQSGQTKAQPSPRSTHQSGQDASPDVSTRKVGLLPFGIGWRERNKGKSTPSTVVESIEKTSPSE